MHAFAHPVFARSSAATLGLVLAGLLVGCGGGGSSAPVSGDPNQLSIDELVIPAGQERDLVAERVTIRSRFDVKGTLALSLPAGSSAGKVILDLPEGAVIEGTIALRQPAQGVAASLATDDRKRALAAGVRPAAFAPRHVPSLVIGGIAGVPLIVYSTARFQTPAGDDAPEEVLADLSRLAANGSYTAASGGNGGDIEFSSLGVVVFRFPIGTPPGSWFRPFAPGNGGKGADLVLKDSAWTDAGITRMTVLAGAGGRSGRLFVDAAELRLEGDRPGDTFAIQAQDGTGVGGAGGNLTWDVVRPDLTALQKIDLVGGTGGGGVGQGGPGGVARFAAGKPLTPATAPRTVNIMVAGGDGGVGGEDDQVKPMVTLPQTRTPKEPVVWAFGGSGGSVTAVAHTGVPGTAMHPDGYEPGPLEVRFGWGGDVSIAPLFVGRAGDGGGMQPGNDPIRGGDGGDGYASSCSDVMLAVGGAGGRSGHLTVRAGIGGSGPIGGNAGALFYDGVDPGKPGKGGKGLAAGPAGLYGQPDRAPVDPPFGTDVRDEAGLRLEGVMGGQSRDGGTTVSSRVQGAFVPPAQTPGAACSVAPPVPTGLIPLPAPVYRARSWSTDAPGEVSQLEVSVIDGCMFFDPRTAAVFGPGVGSQTCINVHEVKPDVNSPTGSVITERTLTSFGNGDIVGGRAQQFIQRASFCGVEGNLVLPGSSGFTERFEPIDTNGNLVPGLPTLIVDHSATGAPIYPAEVERTKDYCCAPSGHYPNGRGAGYVIRSLVNGVCVPPLS
ncbi:MAG: hypothetical protein K8R60_12095 [Burkholderiales bacterium]|nr:hypothetical protein [Burkholderiales bacterium]